jgi:hypothetical protein
MNLAIWHSALIVEFRIHYRKPKPPVFAGMTLSNLKVEWH